MNSLPEGWYRKHKRGRPAEYRKDFVGSSEFYTPDYVFAVATAGSKGWFVNVYNSGSKYSQSVLVWHINGLPTHFAAIALCELSAGEFT